jgi:hypothetical protein
MRVKCRESDPKSRGSRSMGSSVWLFLEPGDPEGKVCLRLAIKSGLRKVSM